MTITDPADRPAAVELVTNCPPAHWPQVSAFLQVEQDTEPAARFAAACRLAEATDDDAEALAWLLVAAYLQELHEMSA
jgi:hypothetical protein